MENSSLDLAFGVTEGVLCALLRELMDTGGILAAIRRHCRKVIALVMPHHLFDRFGSGDAQRDVFVDIVGAARSNPLRERYLFAFLDPDLSSLKLEQLFHLRCCLAARNTRIDDQDVIFDSCQDDGCAGVGIPCYCCDQCSSIENAKAPARRYLKRNKPTHLAFLGIRADNGGPAYLPDADGAIFAAGCKVLTSRIERNTAHPLGVA